MEIAKNEAEKAYHAALHERYAEWRLPSLEIDWRERELVQMFMLSVRGGKPDELLNINPLTDTIVTEMALRYGRADIVIFYADGSITVVEAKDGINGYTSIVSGIGQVTLYATQLAGRYTSTAVRRALMWASTGSVELDEIIHRSCMNAGVIPLSWPSLNVLKDGLAETTKQVMARMQESA